MKLATQSPLQTDITGAGPTADHLFSSVPEFGEGAAPRRKGLLWVGLALLAGTVAGIALLDS